MENQTLKLTVDKGPRKGETLECKPGSAIRIGRVVRGNTFTIKDPSISQKHLSIEFNGDKWVVSDLDTSNGTFLNDLKLKSIDPFDLSNGDVIKIGESTTLNVFIELECRDRSPEANRLRRNPRRGARVTKDNEKKKPGRLDSCMESNGDAAVVGNRRRRAAATTKGTRVLKDEVSEVQSISEKMEVDVENSKDLGIGDSVKGDLLRTNEIGVEEGKDSKKPEESGSCMESTGAVAVVGNRGKRAATKGTRVLEDEVAEVRKDLGTGDSVKGDLRCEIGVEGKDSKKPERSDSCMESNGAVSVFGNRAATKGTRFLRDEVSEVQMIPERLGVEVEDQKDLGTGDRIKEDLLHTNEIGIEEGKNSLFNEKEGTDLENMTLGEWFDRMERYLPKQIHDISEEIILNMRTRAKQFQEYISMLQGKGKGKLPMN